jgi:hypothetical protein
MKIRELLSESRTGSLQDDVAKALPAAYVFPTLQNNNPYSQYRMGLAIATARRLNDPDPYNIVKDREEFSPESAWGENLIVVSYEEEDNRTLELAAKLMNVPKRKISSTRSQESSDVYTQSPTKPVK